MKRLATLELLSHILCRGNDHKSTVRLCECERVPRAAIYSLFRYLYVEVFTNNADPYNNHSNCYLEYEHGKFSSESRLGYQS